MNDLVYLCDASALEDNGVLQVTPSGFEDGIAVYRLGDEYFATDDMCTHALVSLSDGDIEDGIIYCPLHGGAFDIRTGEAKEYPCTRPLKTYDVEVKDGAVYADLGSR